MCFVSIPSLAGQTARLDIIPDDEALKDSHVSIPSLAGQTARLDPLLEHTEVLANCFNPLISGADRATIRRWEGANESPTQFQSPH